MEGEMKMGFMENLQSNLQSVAKKSEELAQTAAKKSGEILEITKLNKKIREEERSIELRYMEIGKIMFEKYSTLTEIPEEISDYIRTIQIKNEVIANLNAKIEEIRAQENNFNQ